MKIFQITVLASALSIGQAWAADDVGLPAMPSEPLNQDQLLTVLEALNTVEVEQAEFAIQHAANADLKALAQKLADEHTSSNERIEELKRADFEPQPSDLSEQIALQAGERLDGLTNLDDAKFDCVFLSDQADQHQLGIQLVGRHLESPDEMTEPVQEFLAETLTHLEGHSQTVQAMLEQTSCPEMSATATR